MLDGRKHSTKGMKRLLRFFHNVDVSIDEWNMKEARSSSKSMSATV